MHPEHALWERRNLKRPDYCSRRLPVRYFVPARLARSVEFINLQRQCLGAFGWCLDTTRYLIVFVALKCVVHNGACAKHLTGGACRATIMLWLLIRHPSSHRRVSPSECHIPRRHVMQLPTRNHRHPPGRESRVGC
uniref:Uncharacterized protein n=1 Tax=Anopheles coluzzii TaxID=1518534 RepID=A0A8W7PTU2_ANOCL